MTNHEDLRRSIVADGAAVGLNGESAIAALRTPGRNSVRLLSAFTPNLASEYDLSPCPAVAAAAKQLRERPCAEAHRLLASEAKIFLENGKKDPLRCRIQEGSDGSCLLIIEPPSCGKSSGHWLECQAARVAGYNGAIGFDTAGSVIQCGYYNPIERLITLPWANLHSSEPTPGAKHELAHFDLDVEAKLPLIRIVPHQEDQGLFWVMSGLEGGYGVAANGRGIGEEFGYGIQAKEYALHAQKLLDSSTRLNSREAWKALLVCLSAADQLLVDAEKCLRSAYTFQREDEAALRSMLEGRVQVRALPSSNTSGVFDREITLIVPEGDFHPQASIGVRFRSADVILHADSGQPEAKIADVKAFLRRALESIYCNEPDLRDVGNAIKATRRAMRAKAALIAGEISLPELLQGIEYSRSDLQAFESNNRTYETSEWFQGLRASLAVAYLNRVGVAAKLNDDPSFSISDFGYVLIEPKANSDRWQNKLASKLSSTGTKLLYSTAEVDDRAAYISQTAEGRIHYLSLPWTTLGAKHVTYEVQALLFEYRHRLTLEEDWRAAAAGVRVPRPYSELEGRQLPIKFILYGDERSDFDGLNTMTPLRLGELQRLYLQAAKALIGNDSLSVKKVLKRANREGQRALEQLSEMLPLINQAISILGEKTEGACEEELIPDRKGGTRELILPTGQIVEFQRAQVEARYAPLPVKWVAEPHYAYDADPRGSDWSYQPGAVCAMLEYVRDRMLDLQTIVRERQKEVGILERQPG